MHKHTALTVIAIVCALFVGAAGLVLTAWSARAVRPDPVAGKAESALCSACHGADGLSPATEIPNLAGQHYQYLLQQLVAYKEGTRKNGVMNEIVRPMTLEQLQNIAAYFSSVRLTVGKGKAGQ